MKPENAESEFEQFSRTSGKQLELLGAREGFELMLDFYRSVRLGSIGGGNKWCGSLSEISEFERFVKSHPATTAVGERNDAIVRLSYDCVG